MTIAQIYEQLISKFRAIPEVSEFLNETVTVTRDFTPEPALMPHTYVPFGGSTPEYRVTALFRDCPGEAYTEKPSDWEGTVEEAISLPATEEEGISPITVAVINSVMSYLGLCKGTFSSDFKTRGNYASDLYDYIKAHYGMENIVLVGYDGHIVKKFVDGGMDFWTLDRDPDNISQDRFRHIVVNSAKLNRESCFAWADVFIVTGSTLTNGTITQFLDHGTDILFYGITIAGTAKLLGFDWFEVK